MRGKKVKFASSVDFVKIHLQTLLFSVGSKPTLKAKNEKQQA